MGVQKQILIPETLITLQVTGLKTPTSMEGLIT